MAAASATDPPESPDPVERAQRALLVGISTLRQLLDLAELAVADRARVERIVDRGKTATDEVFGDLSRLLFGTARAPSPPPPAPASATQAKKRPAAPAPAKRAQKRPATPRPRGAKRTT